MIFKQYWFAFLCLFLNLSGNIFAQDEIKKVNDLLLSAKDKTKSYTEIIKISDDAISLSDKVNYEQGKADALNIMGKAYLYIGEYDDAMAAFWKELAIRESHPDWKNSFAGETYTLIGETYRAIGNFDLSLEYLNKALKIIEKKNDPRQLAYAYDRFAAVYHELSFRRSDSSASFKAVEFGLKSLEISEKLNNKDLIVSTYNIIGAANAFQGKYEESLKHLNRALSEAEIDSTNNDIPNILNNISYIYIIKGEYDKAIESSYRGYLIAKEKDIKIYILLSDRTLSETYFKKGDYTNAFNYLQEAHNLYMTIFDDRKTAEIYGLQRKHETELLEQEENSKSNKRLIIGIGFIFLVLVVSTGIYFRHKQQLLINFELENKNELISEQSAELDRSNKAKDKFLSIVSHDIRNPLNGIVGFTTILDSEYDELTEKERREYIGYLKTSTDSLYKYIDKLLIWSRLQTGRVEIHKDKINIYEIGTIAIGLHHPNAHRKDVIIENNISQDSYVYADRNVLDTVFRNLLDNAVKFTKTGGKVTVSTEVKDKTVNVCISDTGVGISEENLNRIFFIDKIITTKGTHSEEGTGLGLVLCKDMLRLMGSELKVQSKVGEGSKFYFELPHSL